MFQYLQKKWGLSAQDVLLSLCTFAIGGSLCGYISRMLMVWIDIPKGATWWILYFVFLTITWPLCVLLISIPFGQFSFFRRYLKQLGQRVGIGKTKGSAPSQRKKPEHTDSV